LHGGANTEVIYMLDKIHREGISLEKFIDGVISKEFLLFGFGHRVYKTYDPRARIAKKACQQVLDKTGVKDPLLDIAKELEEKALEVEYFKERNLYPNVDFYTGIMLRALGLPTDIFTVLFSIGRLPGWIANWLELKDDPDRRIGRPRQIYTGAKERNL
jgi:citrate synthase